MRFSIVGAGALGTILAAHLIEGGHEVRLVARGKRAAQVREQGLRVRGLREFNVPCELITALDPKIDNDVLVYAVKTYHMKDALAAAQGVRPRTVFSLANGVMKHDQLVDTFGGDAVLGCMANFSGELLDDGSVDYTRNVCLYVGGHDACEEVAQIIHDAGIISAASDNIQTVEWSKFVGWVAFFALSVITRHNTGIFMSNPHIAGLAARMVREAAGVAGARGIELVDQSPMPVHSVATLPLDEAIEKILSVGAEFSSQAPNHRMSSLQDLEAGRALEVHETIGYAVAEAARLGLEAPTLASCYALTAALNELPR